MNLGFAIVMIASFALQVVLFILIYNLLAIIDSLFFDIANKAAIPVLSLFMTMLWAKLLTDYVQMSESLER